MKCLDMIRTKTVGGTGKVMLELIMVGEYYNALLPTLFPQVCTLVGFFSSGTTDWGSPYVVF